MQDFVTAIIPLVFEISLDIENPPLGATSMHSLLEEFLPPYYFSVAYSALEKLLDAGRTMRLCAITETPRKLFNEMVSSLKVSYPIIFFRDSYNHFHLQSQNRKQFLLM
jgi:hypothetical protein